MTRLFLALAALAASAAELDLTRAVVVAGPKAAPLERKAAQVLIEEVGKRSWAEWRVVPAVPPGTAPVIVFTRRAGPPEGYRLTTGPRNGRVRVTIAANDARGALYGAGALLRALDIGRERVSLPHALDVATAPRLPLRGHQLGYRPKTNSYDGWDAALWDQYIRDLAVFGANAIELIPPRSDDAADSPHFPLPPARMMAEMSRLAAGYGMQVWVWLPILGAPADDWAAVLDTLPRLDAVFVPGGDPGRMPPATLMAFLEKQAARIRRRHPGAQMWVSPQGFDRAALEEFYALLAREPRWLTGVVHGPQVRDSIAVLRARTPARYSIRNYPDITHSLRCQHPVPDWDAAFALTLGRETINPRPLGQAAIFRSTYRDTIGFLTYSEGCNDDVNKFLWSALGWNPDADVRDVLLEFSRYFIGPRHAEAFAEGLLALERNWQGPLAANAGVRETLARFQAIEKDASPRELANWRLQQALYRAYYDACVHDRLVEESALEGKATAALAEAPRSGSLEAMEAASRTLAAIDSWRAQSPARLRVFELAAALFQSIRMQLSVPKYRAIGLERGANLDAIDLPLNNRRWLEARFAEIRKLPGEAERLAALDRIVRWTDPGPGGFYDDLGDPAAQPHLLEGALVQFGREDGPALDWRKSMWTCAGALREQPLEMRYTGLDPSAAYRLRVVYSCETGPIAIRLVANGRFEIHPFRKKEFPPRPVEFEIPREATAGGELSLQWFGPPGLGGNGRGNQVAEVWLIKETHK